MTTKKPEPTLASVKQGTTMIDKLGKLQQDLIELADPLLCRTFLPLLQNYLNILVRRVSTLQLREMTDMISIIQELMLNRRSVAGGGHHH